MAYIPLEELTRKNRSLFRLVLSAAERANEINSGAKPLMDTHSKNPTTVALQEFAQGKVYYEEIELPKEEPKPAEDE